MDTMITAMATTMFTLEKAIWIFAFAGKTKPESRPTNIDALRMIIGTYTVHRRLFDEHDATTQMTR